MNEFRAAVGIARVIHGVHTDIDMIGPQHFSITHSVRKENQVAGRHIGRRYILSLHISFRNFNLFIRKGRATDSFHIGFNDKMLLDSIEGGNLLGSLQFYAVALMVVEADRIKLIACLFGYRHAGAAVQPSGKEDYCLFFCHCSLPP